MHESGIHKKANGVSTGCNQKDHAYFVSVVRKEIYLALTRRGWWLYQSNINYPGKFAIAHGRLGETTKDIHGPIKGESDLLDYLESIGAISKEEIFDEIVTNRMDASNG